MPNKRIQVRSMGIYFNVGDLYVPIHPVERYSNPSKNLLLLNPARSFCLGKQVNC